MGDVGGLLLVRVVAGALDAPQTRVGYYRPHRKSSRPAITSVGTLIAPSRSITDHPLRR
jgi:hypothetical protein